jgi:hypothetical protein
MFVMSFFLLFFFGIWKLFFTQKIVQPRSEVHTPRLVSSKLRKALIKIIGVLLYFHHMWGGVIKNLDSEIHNETTHIKVLKIHEWKAHVKVLPHQKDIHGEEGFLNEFWIRWRVISNLGILIIMQECFGKINIF